LSQAGQFNGFHPENNLNVQPSGGGADGPAEVVRVGHLKPLGRPLQNARKWFATCDLERLSRDPVWLDKAIRIVERHVQESNRKQRGQASEPGLAPLDRDGVWSPQTEAKAICAARFS
jgi:hypothetical protein